MELEKMWWKYLGVLLMIYVIIAGLLVPLKPGIIDVKPDRLRAGQDSTIRIIGYNSFYSSSPELWKAYLRKVSTLEDSSEYLLVSTQCIVLSDTIMDVKFSIPQFIPGTKSISLFSVIIDHPTNGASVIPSKIIIQQDSIDDERGKASWTINPKPNYHSFKSFAFPYRNILYETIRNTFFHVSLWFAMFLLLGMSVYFSFKYLKKSNPEYDLKAYALVRTGIIFGLLGCATGSLWAKYTWNAWWTRDIKLNMAALTMLIYLSYLILRASIDDRDRRARISAAYNIFALVASIPLIFILPRLTDSLHPGNGGNPAFGGEDMDNNLRMVFYPSVIGFILIGLWMASLLFRLDRINFFLDEKENN